MPWILGLVAGLLIVFGFRSRKRLMPFETKRRNEWCVLTFEEDDKGNISLVGDVAFMRTHEKRKFNWLVVAETKNAYSIRIEEFDQAGTKYDLFANSDLEGDLPTSQENDPLRLYGRLKKKEDFKDGLFSYSIVVTPKLKGKVAGERSVRGQLEACPVWPCG